MYIERDLYRSWVQRISVNWSILVSCVLVCACPCFAFLFHFISFVAVCLLRWKWILPCVAQHQRLELALALVSPWESSQHLESSYPSWGSNLAVQRHIITSFMYAMFYSNGKWNKKKTFHLQVYIMLCHWATLRSPRRLVSPSTGPRTTKCAANKINFSVGTGVQGKGI